MATRGFLERLPATVSRTLFLVLICASGASSQGTGVGEAEYHNRQGLEHFNKGFYSHAPRNQTAEAQQSYRSAEAEFKEAISKDPACAEAHRNLARVYYVQKKFDGAAEEYRKVTELTPTDVDSYVNRALALIELKRPAEAIRALERAKANTYDEKALETLDSYIAKVRAHQEKEVK